MNRWLPTILVSALVGGIIYLADAGYGIAFFSAVQDAGADQLGHFGLVGLLAFVLNASLGCRLWRNVMLGSFIVGVIFTVEEVSQIWVPNRHFDMLDLAANYAGIWIGGLLARRSCRRGYGRLTVRR